MHTSRNTDLPWFFVTFSLTREMRIVQEKKLFIQNIISSEISIFCFLLFVADERLFKLRKRRFFIRPSHIFICVCHRRRPNRYFALFFFIYTKLMVVSLGIFRRFLLSKRPIGVYWVKTWDFHMILIWTW